MTQVFNSSNEQIEAGSLVPAAYAWPPAIPVSEDRPKMNVPVLIRVEREHDSESGWHTARMQESQFGSADKYIWLGRSPVKWLDRHVVEWLPLPPVPWVL